MCFAYFGISVFKCFSVFKKCTKDSWRQRCHRTYRIHKYMFDRFWSKMVEFWSDFGQIVSQILENFNETLIIPKLVK